MRLVREKIELFVVLLQATRRWQTMQAVYSRETPLRHKSRGESHIIQTKYIHGIHRYRDMSLLYTRCHKVQRLRCFIVGRAEINEGLCAVRE
jgi:hypothetical protein